MTEEEIDKLWDQVKKVQEVENLDTDAMMCLGSVFGQMRSEIRRLQEEKS